MNLKLAFIFVSLALTAKAQAHPVIYQDGWVLQGSFMPNMNKTRMGYSASSRHAFVANTNFFGNIDNYQDYSLGINFLLKRWLKKDSQANVYAGLDGGYFNTDSDEGAVGHAFLMADWESRKHYVVLKTDGYFYEDDERFSYMARFGFAPYVAKMNELQSWFIIQAFYYEEQNSEVILTPMLRFFYRNVLWEIGYSTRGLSFLTLMVHY